MSHSDHASALPGAQDRAPSEPPWPWITLALSTLVLVALILLGQSWLNAGVTLTFPRDLCTQIAFAHSPRREFAWHALAVLECSWLALGFGIVVWRLVRPSDASLPAKFVGLLPLLVAYGSWIFAIANILSGLPSDPNFDTQQGAIFTTAFAALWLGVPALLPTVALALAGWSRLFSKPLKRTGFAIGFLWTQAALTLALFIVVCSIIPLSNCID